MNVAVATTNTKVRMSIQSDLHTGQVIFSDLEDIDYKRDKYTLLFSDMEVV